MCLSPLHPLAALLLFGLLGAAPAHAQDAARYDRAAETLYDRAALLVLNAQITPHWREGPRERFTYRRELGEGRSEFVSVDAATARKVPAFDAAILARGLAAATGKAVDPSRLPFTDYDETPSGLRVLIDGKTWDCARDGPHCTDAGLPVPDPDAVASPDGRWLAFVEAGNLWVRSADGRTRFALTHDAEPRYGYARDTEALTAENAFGPAHPPAGVGWSRIGPPQAPPPPAVLWSPDSRRLFTHRLDEREVRDLSITQSTPADGTVRPVTWTWKSAQANDPVLPMAEFWLFDIAARTGRRLEIDPAPIGYLTPVTAEHVDWSADASEVQLITRTRYAKTMTLHRIDAQTGAVRSPITETGATFVEPGSLIERSQTHGLRNGDVLWFSERSGFGHLYLYDRKGRLKRALTKGAWTVRNLLFVDEARGLAYVSANETVASDDPYFRRVYSVRLRDGAMRLLTPEAADHHVLSRYDTMQLGKPAVTPSTAVATQGFSPSGRYMLDQYSRVDLPTRAVLREAGGRWIGEVERADVSRLRARGWMPPERFHALAADGVTALYGVLWKPSDFDPAKRYPVVDSIYPGPQVQRAWPDFASTVLDRFEPRAYAELGAVVVAMDGRGTAGRSKRFHDASYGRLGDAGGLDDHAAVIRQLAARHVWIDAGRVGIVGSSGGGYAAAHALFTQPDFFTVGVSDAGNHDQRAYSANWGETYNGPEAASNYTDAANQLLAKGLRGKLLLLHGEMDSNVSPTQTLRVAEALNRANKDFELVIAPNTGHTTIVLPGYPMRRAWDFLTRNLIGATPPANYEIRPADVAQ